MRTLKIILMTVEKTNRNKIIGRKPIFDMGISPVKKKFMEGSDVNITQKHFMLIGMKEAFDADLVNKMNNGPAVIEHSYKKEYEDGKSDTIFHLRKSAASGDYFLNKYTMSAQKEGSADIRTQTFYLNYKKDNNIGEKAKENFTYKMAYNFLQGRPVHHAKTDAWERIKPKEKLENGNYASERFDKSYGYNLGKVIDEYSVVYKNALKESLERGNLQKEKFLNRDGQHEELYVTPGIRAGSLILFGLDKKLIPLDQQIAKGFISEDLGQKLKQLQQEQLQRTPVGNKQTNMLAEKPQESVTQTEKIAERQKNGESLQNEKKQKHGMG
ncbi:hypothetical protein KTO58_05640 [Chitinophaga pendula]|uniref:hypothetical protein n=1 Tax=Chitinophaga TaxID=79328 RepID=UPI000BAF3CA3|nr:MULTISPECIES: hypothetical protein [Chitinophaga]ASZ13715.1 hypothetical protein CK934_23535 [Chitinophaga sp. MD30]UCJ08668.1 hypothetical protein KTO58_05640 [Chitinophaga pendula]